MSAMPPPGPIARRAAADALANVGVQEEGGNNRGKFVELYQKSVGIPPGSPWCAAFLRFRLEAADARIEPNDLPPSFPDSGWCPDYSAWGRKMGLLTPVSLARESPSRVAVGDLALFWFSTLKRHAHIGIVVEVHSWGVVTVEGNTGPESGAGVDRDGDGVFRKERDWSELGSMGAFVRLPF